MKILKVTILDQLMFIQNTYKHFKVLDNNDQGHEIRDYFITPVDNIILQIESKIKTRSSMECFLESKTEVEANIYVEEIKDVLDYILELAKQHYNVHLDICAKEYTASNIKIGEIQHLKCENTSLIVAVLDNVKFASVLYETDEGKQITKSPNGMLEFIFGSMLKDNINELIADKVVAKLEEEYRPKYKKKFYKKVKKLFKNAKDARLKPGSNLGDRIIRYLDNEINAIKFEKKKKKLLKPQPSAFAAMKETGGFIKQPEIWNDGIDKYSNNEAVMQNLSIEQLNDKDYIFICNPDSLDVSLCVQGDEVFKYAYAKRIKTKDAIIYGSMVGMSILNLNLIHESIKVIKKWLDDYNIDADYNTEEEIIKQMESLGFLEQWKKIFKSKKNKDRLEGWEKICESGQTNDIDK